MINLVCAKCERPNKHSAEYKIDHIDSNGDHVCEKCANSINNINKIKMKDLLEQWVIYKNQKRQENEKVRQDYTTLTGRLISNDDERLHVISATNFFEWLTK